MQRLTIWFCLILFLFIPIDNVLAQEAEEDAETVITYYSLGQQSLALSVGLFIPLFFQSFGGDVDATNLSLGGVGSLQWGAHLDNHWLLGLEVGGMFCQSLTKNLLLMLPITVKASYLFHIFPFEIPVFLGAGISISKYESQAQVDFMLKPGFSVIWKYSASWGFGLNVVYWWILQPWVQDTSRSIMGNFLETTMTAKYSF